MLLLVILYSLIKINSKPPAVSSINGGFFDNKCLISGTISEYHLTSSGKYKYRLENSILLLNDSEKRSVGDGLIFLDSDNNTYQIGNRILVSGEVTIPESAGNPGEFDEKQYYEQEGISFLCFAKEMKLVDKKTYYVKNSLYKLRERFCDKVNKVCDKKDAGLINSIIFGEKAYLDQDIKELYQKNGIAHMLAISGLHITLLASILFEVLRKYFMKMQSAATVTIIVLILYGQLTGLSIATTRAILMMLLFLLAKILGKRYDSLSALCLAAVITMIQKPCVLTQAGFLLSYVTILGILFFYPALERTIIQPVFEIQYGKKVVGCIKAMIASLSISITTLPIMVEMNYEISTYSFLLNLIVLPFLSYILLSGIGATLVSFCSFMAGRFLFGISHFIFLYYEKVCLFVQSVRFSRIGIGHRAWWQIFAYYLLMILFICLEKMIYKKGVYFLKQGEYLNENMIHEKKRHLLILLIPLVLIFIPSHKCDVAITMIDVGQGDCILVESKDEVMLMDCGSSSKQELYERTISKVLKYKGIDKIDRICISHPDADHMNALIDILDKKEFEVERVELPKLSKPDEKYMELVGEIRKREKRIDLIRKGDSFRVGNIDFECIYPERTTSSEDSNNYSMTLLGFYYDKSFLFTGDLEEEGEDMIDDSLKRKLGKRRLTFLKVGHHGSKSSSSQAFLEALKPVYAGISVGKKNRYGHPHQEVLLRLKNAGTKVYRTDEGGAIMLEYDGEEKISQFRGER